VQPLTATIEPNRIGDIVDIGKIRGKIRGHRRY
jgi:hypothetical protein